MQYDHTKIEKKWQERWEGTHQHVPGIREDKNKFYNLWMFPYPSGEGLHAGHAFASTGSDVLGRYMRMNAKTVFQPIGYDSFGIHGENFALKVGKHPRELMRTTTKFYEGQLRSLGHGYDWTRTVTTSDPDYYKWTQWLFVQMFKAGLAYKKKAAVNWCPGCKTVLADEQIMTPAQAAKLPKGYERIEDVPEGIKICERCGSIPERRQLEQWFFRITKYADRLLEGLKKIDWSQRVVTAQREWIGRSEGHLVKFGPIEVFTTRLDTINGTTFLVLSPEVAKRYLHLVPKSRKVKVSKYIKNALSKSEQERKLGEKQKTGADMGFGVINPATGKQIPVWVADYVLGEVGTGAIMAVPKDDERDKTFAKKFKLPVTASKTSEAEQKALIKRGIAKKQVTYHLRDWLISRQRYWGPPIPMIHCKDCGWQPIPEKDLPVILPEIKDYQPEGKGKGPLANHPEFYKVNCPNCGKEAERETDVSDTFVDSSWYFLRYPSVGLANANGSALSTADAAPTDVGAITKDASLVSRSRQLPWDPEITKKWLPVDLYFGGAEHAVLHLMYARFVTMVLHDLGHLDFEEPFPKFFAHGLVIKDGAKMSKSRGNVVNPDEYVKKYGADTLRLYLMFMGPMDGYPDFRDTGIEGMARFLQRVWKFVVENKDVVLVEERDSREVYTKMHQTIKKVTKDIQEFRYNTAISAIMEFVNLLREKAKVSASKKAVEVRCAEWDEALRVLTQLLAPFAPHIAEELWVEVLGEKFSVHTSKWPKFDTEVVREEEIVIAIQVNGKLRGQITVASTEVKNEEEIVRLAKSAEKVNRWLVGGIKDTIFVPGKVVNFVTNS